MTAPHGFSSRTACCKAIAVSPSLHWTQATGWTSVAESVVTEAPLAIEISYQRSGREIVSVLAVTMRTPGNDPELAIGFLRTEGIIADLRDVQAITDAVENGRGEKIATQRVQLVRAPRADLRRVSRGLLTSSACGFCSRSSLEGVFLQRVESSRGESSLPATFIAQLPELLRKQQIVFSETGGSHGAALCDTHGQALLVKEDVGRHNAVDKIAGAALLSGLATTGKILVLSSRASFELVQKAGAAGIAVVVAVGAPSSLAIAIAHETNVTLIGFARPGRFNVYAHAERLAWNETSKTATGQIAPDDVAALA